MQLFPQARGNHQGGDGQGVVWYDAFDFQLAPAGHAGFDRMWEDFALLAAVTENQWFFYQFAAEQVAPAGGTLSTDDRR